LSKLDVDGYSFKFGNACLSLYKHTCMVGFDSLYDYLYKLNLGNLYDETLTTSHYNIDTKRNLVNECSAHLWHKRLGTFPKKGYKDQ